MFRHSDLMVEKLKASGLGYHVNDVQTYEKIGKQWNCQPFGFKYFNKIKFSEVKVINWQPNFVN